MEAPDWPAVLGEALTQEAANGNKDLRTVSLTCSTEINGPCLFLMVFFSSLRLFHLALPLLEKLSFDSSEISCVRWPTGLTDWSAGPGVRSAGRLFSFDLGQRGREIRDEAYQADRKLR